MLGLVDYSDDDSCSDLEETINQINSEPTKKEDLPPLPAKFWDLYPSKPRIVSTDSSFHDGKIRVNSHVDGLWPSHVYLEWVPNPESVKTLSACLDYVTQSLTAAIIKNRAIKTTDIQVRTLVHSELDVDLPLHVSLSDSIMIPANKKGLFKSAMISACEKIARNKLDLKFSAITRIYLNKTKTRAFIALVLNEDVHLSNLIKQVNHICRTFKKPEFHDLQPHISIGWFDISSMDEAHTLFEKIVLELSYALESELQKINLCFQTAKLKIGNVVTACKLTETQCY